MRTPFGTISAHFDAFTQHGAARPRQLEQSERDAGRIHHAVARNAQRSDETAPQIRLGFDQRSSSSTSRRDSRRSVDALLGPQRRRAALRPRRPTACRMRSTSARVPSCGASSRQSRPEYAVSASCSGESSIDDDVPHADRRRSGARERLARGSSRATRRAPAPPRTPRRRSPRRRRSRRSVRAPSRSRRCRIGTGRPDRSGASPRR